MKRSLIGTIVSVVTIIVMTVCLMVLGVKKPVEKTFEKESLTQIMEKIDIWKLMYKDGKKGGSPTALGKRVYNYFDNIGLAKEDVDNIVIDKGFKSIIGNYLGTMFLNGINGVEVIYPTRGELVTFPHNNYKRFQNVTGFPKDYKEEKIKEIVNDNYQNVKNELDEIAKEIKFDQIKNVELIKKIMNVNSWALIAITIICAVLLLLFTKIFKWLRLISISGIISGIVFIIVGLLGSKILANFIDLKDYQSLIEPVLETILKNMLIYGILLLALSIVAILLSFFIKPKAKIEETKEIKD